jgi:hypothetical protein
VLTVRPANLTIIAKNTGGKFPADKIKRLAEAAPWKPQFVST